MRATLLLHWFLILGFATFVLTDDAPTTTKAEATTTESVLVANDTSTAEQILDYLIENNDAVNFALKRGNNRRKKPDDDTKRGSKPMSLDDQINNRITTFLNKKNEKLKNVTALEAKINETVNQIPELKENIVTSIVEKIPAAPTLPPFFSNAYNRVVTLLGNNKTDMPSMPPKPSEEEILAMKPEKSPEIETKPLLLEDTINEIGSQLIGKLTTKEEIDVTTELISTTKKAEIVKESPVVTVVELTAAPIKTPVGLEPIVAPIVAPKETTKAPVETTVTTPSTTFSTRFVTRKEITTQRSPIQLFSDRVSGVLNRFGIKNQAKDSTAKPVIMNNRYTYSYELPLIIGQPTTIPSKISINNIFPSNVKETVESINNVNSFLQQFGVTIPSTGERNTQEALSDEEIRVPTTYKTTRRPYPWTTMKARPSNDGSTVPADFEEMETTTRRFFPTSFWRKTTTKPTIRYPTKMPSTNKISSELSDANLIDTDNKNITLVKISVVNAGCQSEKSVLMLFNKNQKVLISVDTTDGTESQVVQVEKDQVQTKPSKRPNGVELEIDEKLDDAEEVTQADDDVRLGEEEEATTKAPVKPTRTPTRFTTSKKSRATRTTKSSRISTTTQKLRRTTSRTRGTRKPLPIAVEAVVDYDENEAVTTAPASPTKKNKPKRRRTKGNKKRRKGVKTGNRRPATSAIPADSAVPESVSAEPESI